MVKSGLLHFKDQPENYWAWKASFVNKKDNQMAYPPFSLFAKCICEKAKMGNNPSFSVLCSSGVQTESFKLEIPVKDNYKPSVSIRNTDIENDLEVNPTSSLQKNGN